MGKVLGKVSGYDEGPIAYIGGVPTPKGKRTNHMFAGPDYSIVHPGVFPHHPEAESIASFREWLQFDIAAGWGTKEFESEPHDADRFPAAWQNRRHRLRAAGASCDIFTPGAVDSLHELSRGLARQINRLADLAL